MRSLRKQLTLGLVLSLVFLLTLQWVVVTFTIDYLIRTQMVERMRQEAEGLLAGLDINSQGQLTLSSRQDGSVYQRPFSGHYYVILHTQEIKIRSRSLWDMALPLAPLAVGQQVILYLPGPEKQPLMVLGHGYRKQHQIITIFIAESLMDLQRSLNIFHWVYGLLSLFGLMALLGLQRWIVLRSLQPLREVTESLARVASGDAQQINTKVPMEILPLVNEFNRILRGVTQKSKRSRIAMGNLAHALKTKLAQVQLLLEQGAPEPPSLMRASAGKMIDDIHQHVERTLKRSRLMGEIYVSHQTDFAIEIPALVSMLQKIYFEKEVAFGWQHGLQTKVLIDREDALELLGNVLDNAFKWCQSQVQLNIEIHGNHLDIMVEDDGPGSSALDLRSLLQRGTRMDESKPGSGLGLAIVHDIVQHYHGSIHLENSGRLGGLRMMIKMLWNNPDHLAG